ncbi:MAG: hypothetical protein WC389_17160 [Lutibacter sp.]|jgi:hypothetical protein
MKNDFRINGFIFILICVISTLVISLINSKKKCMESEKLNQSSNESSVYVKPKNWKSETWKVGEFVISNTGKSIKKNSKEYRDHLEKYYRDKTTGVILPPYELECLIDQFKSEKLLEGKRTVLLDKFLEWYDKKMKK